VKRLAAALLVAAFLVTGCGEPPAKSDSATHITNYTGSDYAETKIKLTDGRTVLCVRYIASSYGTSSCDWEHAK